MIIIRLDRVLADRKMRLNDLAAQVGISNVNLSYLKTGKVKAVRFSTLDAICKVLKCQPGDILEYVEDEDGRCDIETKCPKVGGRVGQEYEVLNAYLRDLAMGAKSEAGNYVS